MVHLSTVHRSPSASPGPAKQEQQQQQKQQTLAPETDGAPLHKSLSQLKLASYEDEFTTSVYGSRFAGQDLPKNHIPECQMPRDVAYHMIKDHLSLDNNPKLK